MCLIVDQFGNELLVKRDCKSLRILNGPLGSEAVCEEPGRFDPKSGCIDCPICKEEMDERIKEAMRKKCSLEFTRKLCPFMKDMCEGDLCICLIDTGNSYKCTMTGIEKPFQDK